MGGGRNRHPKWGIVKFRFICPFRLALGRGAGPKHSSIPGYGHGRLRFSLHVSGRSGFAMETVIADIRIRLI